MVFAAILAAGRSSRMGRPKALLPHRDPSATFVRYLVDQAKLAGLQEVLVVGRRGDEGVRAEATSAGARWIVNPSADLGQLSSVVAALEFIGLRAEAEGLLIMPVDVPLVSSAIIQTLLGRAERSVAQIVRPVYQGIHGHPVLFKRSVFDELCSADPAVGAREVVRKDPGRVLDVEVDDASVAEDVDTPEDYERLFGRRCQ